MQVGLISTCLCSVDRKSKSRETGGVGVTSGIRRKIETGRQCIDERVLKEANVKYMTMTKSYLGYCSVELIEW